MKVVTASCVAPLPRLSEEVIRQIAILVESGKVQIDQRFPSERTLEQQWRVSRPVLREAFRALENQGLIESRRGGGRYLRASFIPDPAQQRRNRLVANRETILQIWEAREGAEVAAAALAAVRATTNEIAELKSALRLLESLPPVNAKTLDLDRSFHLVVARAARNPFLLEMIENLIARMGKIGFRDMLGVDDFKPLLKIHQPILRAIAARDPKAARQAMVDHYAKLRRTLP